MTTQDKIDILKEFVRLCDITYKPNGRSAPTVIPKSEQKKYNNAKQWLAELEKQNKPFIKNQVDFDWLEEKDRQSRL